MDVTVQVVDGRTAVVLVGELDAAAHEQLDRAVVEALARGLPIDADLRQVTFMDSAGVSAIARLAGASPERLRVIGARPFVRELLEITGVDQIVEMTAPDDDPVGPPRG